MHACIGDSGTVCGLGKVVCWGGRREREVEENGERGKQSVRHENDGAFEASHHHHRRTTPTHTSQAWAARAGLAPSGGGAWVRLLRAAQTTHTPCFRSFFFFLHGQRTGKLESKQTRPTPHAHRQYDDRLFLSLIITASGPVRLDTGA